MEGGRREEERGRGQGSERMAGGGRGVIPSNL